MTGCCGHPCCYEEEEVVKEVVNAVEDAAQEELVEKAIEIDEDGNMCCMCNGGSIIMCSDSCCN